MSHEVSPISTQAWQVKYNGIMTRHCSKRSHRKTSAKTAGPQTDEGFDQKWPTSLDTHLLETAQKNDFQFIVAIMETAAGEGLILYAPCATQNV
jgi:hypothetical protein